MTEYRELVEKSFSVQIGIFDKGGKELWTNSGNLTITNDEITEIDELLAKINNGDKGSSVGQNFTVNGIEFRIYKHEQDRLFRAVKKNITEGYEFVLIKEEENVVLIGLCNLNNVIDLKIILEQLGVEIKKKTKEEAQNYADLLGGSQMEEVD